MSTEKYHRVATREDRDEGIQLVASEIAEEDDDYPHTWKDAYFNDKPNIEAVFDHDSPVERDAHNFTFFAKLLGFGTAFGMFMTLLICLSESDIVAVLVCVSLLVATCFLCSNRGDQALAWLFGSALAYHTAITTTGLRMVQTPRPSLLEKFWPIQDSVCVLHVPYDQIQDIEIGPIDLCTPETVKVLVKTKSPDETSFVLTGIPAHTPRTFLPYCNTNGDTNVMNQTISLYGLKDPYRFKKVLLRKLKQQQRAQEVTPQAIVRAEPVE